MAKPKPVVEQIDGESRQDYIKFYVFVEMGTNRSLDKAYKMFYETTKEVTSSWRTLADKYHWMERASEYDKMMQASK